MFELFRTLRAAVFGEKRKPERRLPLSDRVKRDSATTERAPKTFGQRGAPEVKSRSERR